MDEFINWLAKNKEWIFSGIGLAIIGWIGRVLYRGKTTSTQNIKSGKNSQNIQAGRDVNIK